MKKYRLHVIGVLDGEEDIKIYPLSKKPRSSEEVRKIAEDFSKIEEAYLEEITPSSSTLERVEL